MFIESRLIFNYKNLWTMMVISWREREREREERVYKQVNLSNGDLERNEHHFQSKKPFLLEKQFRGRGIGSQFGLWGHNCFFTYTVWESHWEDDILKGDGVDQVDILDRCVLGIRTSIVKTHHLEMSQDVSIPQVPISSPLLLLCPSVVFLILLGGNSYLHPFL
jgi:hypothetical protein